MIVGRRNDGVQTSGCLLEGACLAVGLRSFQVVVEMRESWSAATMY